MEVKERSEIQQQYKWDLTSLFESDEKWEEKLASLKGQQQVALSYQGKLDNAQTIYQYLKWDYSITSDLSDLFCYASLRHSEDTRDSSATSMYSRIYSLYVEISSASAFARPEILSLQDDKLKAIIEEDRKSTRLNSSHTS